MSSLPARYESFLISNSATIGTIESSLRSLTWFLPGRFKDAEIVGEALNSTLNLLSLYHDTLLSRRLQLVKSQNPRGAGELIPPSSHTRYTRSWSEKDGVYKWAARGVEVLRFSQLVVEMMLRRFTGRMGRWRGVFLLELAKALLRFVLLVRTRRPILSPPIPERDVDPASLPALLDPASPPLKPARLSNEETEAATTTSTQVPLHIQNNHIPFNPSSNPHGKPHPLLSSLPDTPLTRTIIEDYLLPKALTPSLVKSPINLLNPINGMGQWISEALYIARPLIYVILLRPTKDNLMPGGSSSINHNIRSMAHSLRTPLAVSLLLTLLSRQLRPIPPVAPESSNSLERQEYARRDKEMVWNLFRGEIWNEWTRPRLESWRNAMEGKPLLGLFAGVLGDYVPLVDEYYYYTAT